MNDSPMTADGRQLVNRPLVQAHLLASFGWFVLSILAGLLFSTQFVRNYVFPDVELLSPGRIRMVHTHLVAFGWIFNALLAGMIWSIPRLTGQRILSDGLGWLIFVVWQSIMAAAVVGILMGQAQGLEWGENPVWIDPLVVVGWVLVVTNLITPILRSKERNLYVSLWYFLAAFIWTGLTYVMGNFFPQYWVPGVAGAAVTGLYIHDLVGLWVTPMGWGMMYFFVPIILRTPIWSHALSLVGFWGLAFFYPLQGVHHFLGSPIPMFAQYSAVISTIAVEIVVATVIINFFMTHRASKVSIATNIPIRWFWLGAANYFVTCLQCAFQVTLTFQQVIHFTDWVVGHAHLVMFGVFSFWLFGMIEHLWPKLVGCEWWSQSLRAWFFWLTAGGLWLMFLTLTASGLAEGFMSLQLVTRESILQTMRPFWIVRTLSGVSIVAGFSCLAWNMIATARRSTAEHVDEDYAPYEQLEEEVTVGAV